ncbi:MAG: hypothetical protein IPJ65_03935 [Archangiaceae bacterium]|nr:hypothetical protein [Archangiaceae bacterium]
MSEPVTYSQARALTAQQLGGKAHLTVQLHRHGLPVPPGLVLTTAALEQFCAAHAAAPLEHLARAPLPRAALDAVLRRFGATLLAVRSSVVGEDAASRSLAGRFHTELCRGAEGLSAAVRRCWLAAVEALLKGGAPPEQALARVALLIQPVAFGERSAVCFTRSPASAHEALVVATFGSCHTLVEGRSAADEYRFARRPGPLRIHATVSTKRELTVLDPPPGFSPGQPWRSPWGPTTLHLPLGPHLASARVPLALQQQPTLSAAQVEAVWRAARAAEHALQAPADVELTLRRGKVVLLQARPITTVSSLGSSRAAGDFRVASPGCARGRVRVVRSVAEAGTFARGDVLVVRATTPAFLPLLERAGAVLSEEGSSLAHTAIVARELGVPCLMGVEGATTGRFVDGEWLTVDATAGEVRRDGERRAAATRSPSRLDPVVRALEHLPARASHVTLAASALLDAASVERPAAALTVTRVTEALEGVRARCRARSVKVEWDLADDRLPRDHQAFDAAALEKALVR